MGFVAPLIEVRGYLCGLTLSKCLQDGGFDFLAYIRILRFPCTAWCGMDVLLDIDDVEY